MISILIPIYNFAVKELVSELSRQAQELNLDFEILCIDDNSKSKYIKLNKDIEKIEEVVEASASTPIEYITLSLSGGAELWGGTIHESGSAKAEDRHWERAYKIIRAFDASCKKHGSRRSLHACTRTHTHTHTAYPLHARCHVRFALQMHQRGVQVQRVCVQL